MASGRFSMNLFLGGGGSGVAKGIREDWIDAARGFLILLVVLGHAFGTASHLGADAETSKMCSWIYKVIYMFHMPAFFVLAGVTWSAGKDGFGAYVKKKAMRLLVPYFVFGFLSIGAGVILGRFLGSVGHDGYYTANMVRGVLSEVKMLLMGDGCSINSPLWFLPSMFAAEVLYYWLSKCDGLYGWRWLLPAFLIAAAWFNKSLFISSQLARIMVFVMYLHLGRMMISKQRLSCLVSASAPVRCLSCLALGAYLSVCWFLPWEVECNGFLPFVGYKLVAFAGAILVFEVCQCFPAKPLCVCGIASIGILVMHKFPLAAIQMKVPMLSQFNGLGILVMTFALSLFVASFCVVIAAGLRKWMPILLGEMHKGD